MSSIARAITSALRDMTDGLRNGLDSPDAWVIALVVACAIIAAMTRA